MIFWRPPVEFGNAKRKWYDTELCRSWPIEGLLASIWVGLFFPTLGLTAANDEDHVNW